MKLKNIIVIAGIAALFSTSALGATVASIQTLPNNTEVTLSGIVENFDSKHSFLLSDSSGKVPVDLSGTKSIILKDGEPVTVTGNLDKALLGTTLVASKVVEDKTAGQRVGEAINSVTGQNAAGSAQSSTIAALPESGLVKIDGVVDNVSDEKNFTLKDSTGHVDVNIKAAASASLMKGTEVTVIGNVNKGVLGTKISATEVDIRSSSMPIAKK